jgi:hypothetical protein
MKTAYRSIIVLLLLGVASCAPSISTQAPEVEQEAQAEPSAATATLRPTLAPTPTTEKLQLEVVNSIVWVDKYGQIRGSVMVRNPYDFPVEVTANSLDLYNAAGDFVRGEDLYFLDGISGGGGFLLPGETVAAGGCFSPCDGPPSDLEWASYEFAFSIREATNNWTVSTDVEASVSSIEIDGDSPLFWVYGTVTNNSDEALQRVSARVFVYDQEGNFVGAAEVSAYDVPAGATVSVDGYGIGSVIGLSVDYEVSAAGVNYTQ